MKGNLNLLIKQPRIGTPEIKEFQESVYNTFGVPRTIWEGSFKVSKKETRRFVRAITPQNKRLPRRLKKIIKFKKQYEIDLLIAWKQQFKL